MPNAGETIGSYELLRKLGAGAFGEVWLARHGELGRECALKIPTDPDYIQQLRKEGRIQFGLKHRNVVEALDLDTLGATPHLVMEYVEGEDLRKRLQTRGKLPPAEALPIVRQILDALAAAHAQGIVHHDLKPENVLLTTDGTVKVADFGLGRIQATVAQSLLLSGSLISRDGKSVSGTYEYMSPEQQRGEAADPRDDLYALGVIGCELLTGRRPTGLGVARMFEREKLSPSLADLFERALDDREHAYRSAAEMIAATAEAAAEKKTSLDVVLHEASDEKRRRADEERRARAERRRKAEEERRQRAEEENAEREKRRKAETARQRQRDAEEKRQRERAAELERLLRERDQRDTERPPAAQRATTKPPSVVPPRKPVPHEPPAEAARKSRLGCVVLPLLAITGIVFVIAFVKVDEVPIREMIFGKRAPTPEQPAPSDPLPVFTTRGLYTSSSAPRRLSVSLRWATRGADIVLIVVEPNGLSTERRRAGPGQPTGTLFVNNPAPGRYEVQAQYLPGCEIRTEAAVEAQLGGQRLGIRVGDRWNDDVRLVLVPGTRRTVAFVEVPSF